METPADPQMTTNILARVSAYLKEIEHAEDDRKRALEERIANMAKATEDQIQIECSERLVSIKNAESQQLLKLYSKIAGLKREHAVAQHRETKITSWFNLVVCQDLCEQREHQSAGRLLALSSEQFQEPTHGESVVAQVQRALHQGQKVRDEWFKEECSKLEDRCRAARARARDQRRTALDDIANMRISKQTEHERLAAQMRKEEEPTALKKHMDLVHGLEIILMTGEKDGAEEEAKGTVDKDHEYDQAERAARDETEKQGQDNENEQMRTQLEAEEREQQRRQMEAADKVRKERDNKADEEEKVVGQQVQRIQTPLPAEEKVAARDIKKAWSAYASFTKRFEKRRNYHLTFTDITWPVFPPTSDASGITHTSIAKFLFSSSHSVGLPRNARLRAALVRWEPGKFESQWMSRVAERDKKKVKEAVEAVVRGLLRLQAEESL